jgi:hypothetical protein
MIGGERTHQEFVRSTVAFDRRRAQAGVPGFDGAWRREEAATPYWLAGLALCRRRAAGIVAAAVGAGAALTPRPTEPASPPHLP